MGIKSSYFGQKRCLAIFHYQKWELFSDSLGMTVGFKFYAIDLLIDRLDPEKINLMINQL